MFLRLHALRATLFRRALFHLPNRDTPTVIGLATRRELAFGALDQLERVERATQDLLELLNFALKDFDLDSEVDVGRVVDPRQDSLRTVARKLLDLDGVLRDFDTADFALGLFIHEKTAS